MTAAGLVTVLVPVYNEERYVDEILRRVAAVALPKQIVVIDDGSTDRTRDIVEALAEEIPLTLVVMERNSGKGSAIRRGLEEAAGEVVIVQDGDLEYDPIDIPAVVTPILEGRYDVVFGSRFRSSPEGMERRYWLGNRFFTVQTNLLYGAHLTDVNGGYKAFRTDLLRGLNLTCRRFEFCAEVAAKAHRRGYRVLEVPVSYHARNLAEGKKLGWKDAWAHFWCLLKLRFLPVR